MLVLSRQIDESVVVGGTDGLKRLLKVTVLSIRNGIVKLGFEADDDVPVNRLEVWERLVAQRQKATTEISQNEGWLNLSTSPPTRK
jgi:carbon storage regulator CsrA